MVVGGLDNGGLSIVTVNTSPSAVRLKQVSDLLASTLASGHSPWVHAGLPGPTAVSRLAFCSGYVSLDFPHVACSRIGAVMIGRTGCCCYCMESHDDT